jgi:hypothetical protein
VDIENPIALHFIMQDDLFLLNKDLDAYNGVNLKAEIQAIAEPVAVTVRVAPAVDKEEIAVVAEITIPVEFKYRGKKNNLLVMVHYPDHEFIHDTHLPALENILKRTGVAIDEVAILNMAAHNNAGFESINTYFNPQKILLLGKAALPEGIAPLKLNTPQLLGHIKALYSFSFDEMMDSPENKKVFWEQMKLL